MTIEFTVPGEPVGKGRPRFNRATGRAYTPDRTATYENLVKLEYERAANGARFPDGTPLRMYIEAWFGIPRSASKKQASMMEEGAFRPTKKPDADNILKIIADSLNGVAYRDDTQIVNVKVVKCYAYEPKVYVRIAEA